MDFELASQSENATYVMKEWESYKRDMDGLLVVWIGECSQRDLRNPTVLKVSRCLFRVFLPQRGKALGQMLSGAVSFVLDLFLNGTTGQHRRTKKNKNAFRIDLLSPMIKLVIFFSDCDVVSRVKFYCNKLDVSFPTRGNFFKRLKQQNKTSGT